MKNNTIKYILCGLMALLATFQCFAAANPAVSDVIISPAPAVFPGGIATVQFRFNNNGSTATSSSFVTVTVSLSQLDFISRPFNVNTDIIQTEGNTPFTWSYETSTRVLTGTLNGTFTGLTGNIFQVRNLDVTAASAMSNPTIGANINVVAPNTASINSSVTDDNASGYTYTTAVLPIELLLFQATKLNDCESKLKWVSGEESYFDYYQLEQSTDSKSFRALGDFQKSKGNNSTYEQIADLKNANSHSVYYRLRMVDLDRSTKYSKIISVQNDCAKKNSISISPNPASNTITIKGLNTKGSLYIYDMTGRVWMTASITELGNQQVNIENLVEGTYMIQVRSEQGTYNSKLVKQ